MLLEIKGIIEGKTIDIELNKIVKQIYNTGAKIVLKNTYKLRTSYLEI